MKRYLRSFTTRDAGRQIVRLAVVGVGNTVIYFALFNLFRVADVSLFWSITLAFGTATLVSYVINRRWTFGLEHNSGGMVETFNFYLVNLVAWGVTVLIVMGAERLFGPLGRLGENVAALAAAGIILIPKFASYRDVVFRKALATPPSDRELAAE